MKEREWMLRDAIVNEPYEYKNLGVLKNYVKSFASNVEDDIERARKNAGMTLAIVKQTHSFISNFGGKHVCFPCYLALNSLH